MKSIMVQGTCSGAGKSLLVAGLCRVLSDMGHNVAPFKSQNMALNSYVTASGAEIGRAQALQAEAARVSPAVEMNPVLLKAMGESGCQVVLNGKVHSNMSAREYYAFKNVAWGAVEEAYKTLSDKYDVVVIEGAGSPAEINLTSEEIVNMRVARHAHSPVILVGDIDRGGVFASLYGTMGLLGDDAKRIKGFVINRFRGDQSILDPGLETITKLTGVPVLGVLPYIRDVGLDEEDSLALVRYTRAQGDDGGLRVVVVMLDFISNFTDFSPLMHEPGVSVVFSSNPAEIEGADVLILPGSKNTIKDLSILRERGLDRAILKAASKGAQVVGVCGGLQMLGQRIADPEGIEGPPGEARGLALLDIETQLSHPKVLTQCVADASGMGISGEVRGYEIHMGRSTGELGLMSARRLATGEVVADGSRKGNVWGTYLHGIFDNDNIRDAVLNPLREARGLPLPEKPFRYMAERERLMDAWADVMREHLDMKQIMDMAGIG